MRGSSPARAEARPPPKRSGGGSGCVLTTLFRRRSRGRGSTSGGDTHQAQAETREIITPQQVPRRHVEAEYLALGCGDDPILIQQQVHKIATCQFRVPEFLAGRTVERYHLAVHANENWSHPFTSTPFTSTPAHSSTVLTMVVKSASAPWRSAVIASSSRIALPQIMGTPNPAASSVHSFTSFNRRPMAKPKSKVRGRIDFGNLSTEALLRPVPELMTSSMTWGSRPPLTPITITSEVPARAAADSILFASFIN